MTSGKDFIIGHVVRDLVLARLTCYHLGAFKVFESLKQGLMLGSLLAGEGQSRDVLNSRASCAVQVPPHHKLLTLLSCTSFYHTLLCNVCSTRSPLVAGINLCLGGR